MANNSWTAWSRGETGSKFFNKHVPDLIKALNKNTEALNALLTKQSSCQKDKQEPKPKPNKDDE